MTSVNDFIDVEKVEAEAAKKTVTLSPEEKQKKHEHLEAEFGDSKTTNSVRLYEKHEKHFLPLGEGSEALCWIPKDLVAVADEIVKHEQEANNISLHKEIILASLMNAFSYFVAFSHPVFVKNGYSNNIEEWDGGKDLITKIAGEFFVWKWKHKEKIDAYLEQRLPKKGENRAKRELDSERFLVELFAESWIKSKKAPTLGADLQQPNATVPDTIRAVLTDNQFFNKLLHGENLEKIEALPTTREDGTPLKGFGLITNRNSPPLTYKDKLILFAALSIADNNKITDTDGQEVGAVTVSDIVAQLQPKKIKTAYKKDSELYREVEASFEQMRNTKISLVSKDFLQNRRGEELPENKVLAKEQPLIIADRAFWSRRGNIVEGYLWHDSEPIKMIKEDFDWRFSVQIARDIMPKNLSGPKLNLFAFLLERACNTLPTLNTVYIYGKGREDQQTLLKALGWLDISLINRTKTKDEISKDQTYRKQIESILKVLESGPFKVERILDNKKKLIGVTVKYIFKDQKILEE